MDNKDINAYYIDNNYYLLTMDNISAIYEVRTKKYYRFICLDDLSKDVQDNIDQHKFTDALLHKSKEIKLSAIDGNALNKFELELNKPFIAYDYTKNYQKLIDVKQALEPYYKIKVNADKDIDKYYYNYNTKRYELLTIFKLGYLLEQDFNIILTEREVNTLYGLFRDVQEPNNDAIAFNNVILDTSTFEILEPDTFTVKKIDYDYLPINEVKRNTLTERTLKQILIPSNKPNDTDVFIDFLQRVGASFKKVNKHKMIILFTGDGNDGKSIILNILQILNGSLSLTIRPKQLTEDEFFTTNLSDTNVLIMDELNKNSFNPYTVTVLKDISGRGSLDSRLIHKQDLVKVKNYGVLFISTNTVPYVPFTDIAYWNRLIIIKLPNKFDENAEQDDLDNNLYVADPDLSFKLENDKDGIEWLISASIEAYKNMSNGFNIKQTALETQFLYDGANPLRTFLESYIYETNTKTDRLSNKEIVYNLINWCNRNNITAKDLDVNTINELRQDIGTKIKNFKPNLEKARAKDGTTAYSGLALNIEYDKENIHYELDALIDDFFN